MKVHTFRVSYTRFTKLDMLGKEDHYHWATLTNVSRGRFKQTAQGKKPYNKDFFGFYKSHRDETTNKGNYKDARFSVFQTKHKVLAALFAVALVVAGWNIWGFWHPKGADVKPLSAKPAASQPAASEVVAAKPVERSETARQTKQDEAPEPIDYLDKQAMKYDLRLSAIMDRKDPQPGQAAYEFVLDFLDPSYRVKERMGRKDVVSLGWAIERKDFGLLISKDAKSYVVRPWPLDNFGKVPQQQIAALKPAVTPALAQP